MQFGGTVSPGHKITAQYVYTPLTTPYRHVTNTRLERHKTETFTDTYDTVNQHGCQPLNNMVAVMHIAVVLL